GHGHYPQVQGRGLPGEGPAARVRVRGRGLHVALGRGEADHRVTLQRLPLFPPSPTVVVSHPVVARHVCGNGRRVPGAGAPAAIATTPGPARPASGGPTPPAAGAPAPREP